ncbi:MAG: pseudouridine synthase [Proteobacteria bacterium]|nr:pseudouridine synthase [Pseudomonadota bacterium]MCL2308529.1 pseudouridine synthase [Pseudomonadota bacterium]
MARLFRLLRFHKPYGVQCQFTGDGARPTLADFIDVPGVYPAGRLDADSEGLLLLTDQGSWQAQIADPRHRLVKTYWAQVEGLPDDEALRCLARGVALRDGMTRPAKVRRIDEPPNLWPRVPPIRFRAAIPTTWLELQLTEGKNRQVRRMTAAVGHPTLRLIRARIGPWTLEGLAPGQWQFVDNPTDMLSLPAMTPTVATPVSRTRSRRS